MSPAQTPHASAASPSPSNGKRSLGIARVATDATQMFYTMNTMFISAIGKESVAAVTAIRGALSTVEDPELGLDIVSLGLVYGIECADRRARVVYSLTSMGCPMGPTIDAEIRQVVGRLDGVEAVETELVFDPPWAPEKMSDDARFLLGVY